MKITKSLFARQCILFLASRYKYLSQLYLCAIFFTQIFIPYFKHLREGKYIKNKTLSHLFINKKYLKAWI